MFDKEYMLLHNMYMIKLNYRKMDVEGIIVYYAKYRKNRNIRLSICEDKSVRVTCPYFVTEPEIYDFVKSKIDWIKKALNRLENEHRENLAAKDKLKKKEIMALKSLIDDYVYKYAILMNAEIKDVKLRKMRSEWGNCNYRTGVLTFNTYLYYMSERFIEAIVLHEVAHLFVHSHSKAFYNLINKYMKDYKERIKEGKKVSLR